MAQFGKDPFGAWALKCNPATWELKSFLDDGLGQLAGWVVHHGKRASAMKSGDPVVFWVSGNNQFTPAGVWGVGTVLGPPHHGRPGEHWRDAPEGAQLIVDVDLVVDRLLVPRPALHEDPVLGASELIALPQMSNPAMLTALEWAALQRTLGTTSPQPHERPNRLTIPSPMRRSLRTYAFDPMVTRLSGRYLVVDVPFESSLQPGPVGELVEVVDFDASTGQWFVPVNLDDVALLAQGGLRPAEHDPRTHQQVVYAVSMSVLERFERFLGRRFRWRANKRLRLYPHAFEGRNAYFDPRSRSVMFGYYRADTRNPGPNLPGQWVFTCLSTDIIAHEVTHAIVHRLRRRYSEATNADVFAWHEAFADLVAVFQHFVFPEVVREAITVEFGSVRLGDALLELAQQFGQSTGRGGPLRAALAAKQSPEAFRAATEPHERGAFLVAAVFDGYLDAYQATVADLIRIATGGSGLLPPGRLPLDLVNRLAAETANLADTYLGMVVRAFDYLPVVDVTFGDVVRAIVTADHVLYPDDAANLRGTLVESLRRRGIYPEGVTSLADEALMWPRQWQPLTLNDPRAPVDLHELIVSSTLDLDTGGRSAWMLGVSPTTGQGDRLFQMVTRWAGTNALSLGLDPPAKDRPIELDGIHVTYQQAQDRQPQPQIILQLSQRRRDLEDTRLPEDTRAPYRAGTSVIARIDGQVEYVIAKPLPLSDPALAKTRTDVAEYHRAGVARRDALDGWFGRLEREDPVSPWTMQPAMRRVDFAAIHAQDLDGSKP